MKKVLLIVILFVSAVVFIVTQKHKIVLPLQSMQPPKITASSNIPQQKLFGVNISGAEFGENHLPGIMQTDYIYPSTQSGYFGFSYFASKYFTLIRIPFVWERLQPTAFGPLSNRDLAGLQAMVQDAKQNHQKVILDLHNFGRYYGSPMTRQSLTAFSDFWTKLSLQFKDEPAIYGYELMNEPHDLTGGCQTWGILSQSAIFAIRRNDISHVILVPGYDWQTAKDWPTQSGCLKGIIDPLHKLLFSAHQYFDSDFSGRTYDWSSCVESNQEETLIQPFLNWLHINNVKGMFTEYGVSTSSCWLHNLDNFLSTLNGDNAIIGGTYWSAGPWWGDYNLSVEPINGQDKPQMSILEKYPSQ